MPEVTSMAQEGKQKLGAVSIIRSLCESIRADAENCAITGDASLCTEAIARAAALRRELHSLRKLTLEE